MTQRELERLTGISQSTISAIENNSVNLSVERAKVLARALVPQGANCYSNKELDLLPDKWRLST